MSNSIDYYLTVVSPFSYLGHRALMAVAEKHGCSVNFKPFKLMEVWGESGAVLPAQRPVVRQRYRLLELQRVALMRDTCLNLHPKHWPTDPSLADLSICAISAMGGDPASFAYAAGRAVWEQNEQIADEAVVARLLDETGHDSASIIAKANTEEVAAIRDQNTAAAIAADAIGAPAYVYNGEVFWGQDRIEYLEQMIASGRAAYQAVL